MKAKLRFPYRDVVHTQKPYENNNYNIASRSKQNCSRSIQIKACNLILIIIKAKLWLVVIGRRLDARRVGSTNQPQLGAFVTFWWSSTKIRTRSVRKSIVTMLLWGRTWTSSSGRSFLIAAFASSPVFPTSSGHDSLVEWLAILIGIRVSLNSPHHAL